MIRLRVSVGPLKLGKSFREGERMLKAFRQVWAAGRDKLTLSEYDADSAVPADELFR